jgi:hypothetical protein
MARAVPLRGELFGLLTDELWMTWRRPRGTGNAAPHSTSASFSSPAGRGHKVYDGRWTWGIASKGSFDASLQQPVEISRWSSTRNSRATSE